jgi:hypothetical protein
MGRMSMSESEREQKLREMEADLDSELGLDSVAVSETETVPTKRARGHELNYGQIALGALATFVLTKILGMWAINVVLGISFIAFVIFGILWVIGQFKD